MAWEQLDAEERAAVLRELRAAIAADRYPLSRRVRILEAALAKLDPAAAPIAPAAPADPARPYRPSLLARRKRR